MTAASITAPLPPAAAGRYGLRQAVRMEWIKLRSLRSTWWSLVVTISAAIGIATAVGLSTKPSSSSTRDLTNNALSGVAIGLLVTGVLGVLAMTNEYSSGTIRSTLAAIPDRRLLVAGKAVVFGAVALAAGEVAAFVSFIAGTVTLRHGIAAPTLAQARVLRAVLLTGTGYALVGLFGLGLGAAIRHTPAAIAVMVGGVYVAAQLAAALASPLRPYIPISLVANSMATAVPESDMLNPWAALGVLSLYAAAALAAGAWQLARRDA